MTVITDKVWFEGNDDHDITYWWESGWSAGDDIASLMESGVKTVMTMTVLNDGVWCEDGGNYDSTH